jgi:hypothetical protein
MAKQIERRGCSLSRNILSGMRGGQWWKRYSRELEELYNEPNIVNIIKSSRLRWVGRVVRMDDNELFKGILWTNRGCGRLKSRWIDGVEEDTKKLGCRNWRADAQDRGRWRHLLWADQGLPRTVEPMMMMMMMVIHVQWICIFPLMSTQ